MGNGCQFKEEDIGVCGIAVLDNFSWGISVILILNCYIAVFFITGGFGVLHTCILHGIKNYPQVLQRFLSLFLIPMGKG